MQELVKTSHFFQTKYISFTERIKNIHVTQTDKDVLYVRT